MAEHATIEWTGQSGTTYKYFIWAIGSTFNPGQAGNYIFTRRVPNTAGGFTHHPVYIGETGVGFQERFSDHENAQCIRENGATHVCLRLNADRVAREAEETDLRLRWPTPCNRQ